ncbi:tetratricopeptide repeat protein [Kitasatospora aureofaciens]|uniref:tetratricopeptide repeat protein n=1 Tax=Kitasatospora aureofaciens TaxID=1894 RepID=UPI001C446671|nr:tetratricopeptide repeat protein [Kitasatospora aureofaciens]MBV6700113.1 tetratricopeptide repeat protein [Kitasatospora aureofaciens]
MLQHLIDQDEGLRMVPTDRNELTTAVGQLNEELRGLPEEADPARTRVLTRWIGIGQMCLGHHEEARTFLRQSLDLAAAIGNTRAVVATGLNLGDAHRYAGDVQTADALYRSALNTARSQHPELVDFALQHTGKHLMERGDLAGAQAHLQEALRLRIVKGDAGLVESTQAALARVELLIGQADATAADGAVPRQWSGQWTSWLQSRTTAQTPARWAEDFPTLRDAVRGLTAHQRVHPRHLRDQSFPAELITQVAEEAEKAVAVDGYLHNGKWNAAVGDAASRFAGQVDLAAVVARSTGLDVEQPHTGVYIAYLEEGQFLDFHVDEVGFGEANLILCLKHERPTGAPRAGTTVFINADGYLECDLAAGDCVVFDGALTPHGRTPLSAGESVTLISFGFRARDQASRAVGNLPPAPG